MTTNSQVWMVMDTVDALSAEGDETGDAFLSAPERVRLASVIGLRRKAQFRAGRLLMRKLLARVHGGDPLTDWPLTAAVDAAPTFMGEAFAQRTGAQWHFSISHARNYVACAMSASRLGIDLEVPERERDVLALGDVLCNPEELMQLHTLDAAFKQDYFLALWTLKEAAIKREAGRSSSTALRKLATREITTGDLAIVLDEAPELRSPGATAAPADRSTAQAWTWQSPELTLAVVTEAPCAEPRWAMPPPHFMLRHPSTWAVTVLAPVPAIL